MSLEPDNHIGHKHQTADDNKKEEIIAKFKEIVAKFNEETIKMMVAKYPSIIGQVFLLFLLLFALFAFNILNF